MNIKLHTPKSLKMGSGMASVKQFLLSLFATTVSIALTFGTAGFIDYKKKQAEKHEIVMMVMYDMYNSLKSIEQCDSMIYQSMLIQKQIAEDTTMFDKLSIKMEVLTPLLEFTETTERIFSSSIETINTVGNVLFTENVADFYLYRKKYKEQVCDPVTNKFKDKSPFATLKGTLNFDYRLYAIPSVGLTKLLREKYAQCKQMMEISDEEIDAYREQREQIDKGMSEEGSHTPNFEKIIQIHNSIDSAKSKLKLE